MIKNPPTTQEQKGLQGLGFVELGEIEFYAIDTEGSGRYDYICIEECGIEDKLASAGFKKNNVPAKGEPDYFRGETGWTHYDPDDVYVFVIPAEHQKEIELLVQLYSHKEIKDLAYNGQIEFLGFIIKLITSGIITEENMHLVVSEQGDKQKT